MNWTKWSAISEIVSSVAILVTLVYLAIQVQQATVAVNAEARTTQWQFQMGMLDHLILAVRVLRAARVSVFAASIGSHRRRDFRDDDLRRGADSDLPQNTPMVGFNLGVLLRSRIRRACERPSERRSASEF
ncbi:MAG: hypothetical protein P8Y69_12805 [Gammaproteobacteria bacterium]